MRQLTQKLKNGGMRVLDVSVPILTSGNILVRNHYSLVSAGTEGSTVRTARKGYLGKAKERPQQVKQVLDVIKHQGPVQAYRAVMKKLEAHSPLGYSCAGEVIAVGSDVSAFQVGDRVACGGLSASHAEVVSVPVNLCVKLNPHTDLRQAAYNSLGAIAMQSVRQADLRLGESCAVIGLGLLGQLTCLLLRAAGVRTIGIDIDATMVKMASAQGCDLALERNTPGIEEQIHFFTSGLGCDAVILSAATASLDPINFAGAISRKRGVIVVLGAVSTGFDREPHFYRKELQVRMSCSYGPGRYDPVFEEKGIDYPVSHVRWTENRNMRAFQELIASGRIDVSALTSHIFPLAEAPDAYDLMMRRSEPFIGILIEYEREKEIENQKIIVRPRDKQPLDFIGIGFAGAGSYAQSHLLPNLPEDKAVVLQGVMTASGTGSRSVADRFGFTFCTASADDLLHHDAINTLFIATRHNTHADWVCKALNAGKHVFVEKPLCLKEDELEAILHALETCVKNENRADSPESSVSYAPILMVGYNRRFAPLAEKLKQVVGAGFPLSMCYRINAGSIPSDSWMQDPDIGGGRIIGEVCHFVDFLTWLCGSSPVKVHAAAIPDPHHHSDTVNVSLSYENGSIGVVSYMANGSRSLSKERIEVHGGGLSAILDDFRNLSVFGGSRKQTFKHVVQDKGQKAEVSAFVQAVRAGDPSPIPLAELVSTSRVTFRILESLRTGACLSVETRDLASSAGDPP